MPGKICRAHSFPEEAEEEPTNGASSTADGTASSIDLPYWCEDGGGFGNAAPLDLRYGPNIPVTITVEAPVLLPDGANPDANASFQLTITNLSSDQSWDPSLFALAVAATDTDSSVISHGEWPTGFESQDVAPGESVTFADEWNIADLENVRYELRVDGLAGDTVCFAR